MDTDRSTGPHKCFGAPSSFSGSEDLCEQPLEPVYSLIDRQHNSSVIHQSQGWHDIQDTVRSLDTDLAVVHREEPHHSCGAYPGSSQCESRRRIKEPPPLIRLETRSGSLQEAHEQVGILHNRPICRTAQYPVIKILQFPSRSGGRSIRCSSPELEGREAICLSPIHLDWEIPAEVETGQSQGSSPDSPSMAVPSLVPTTDGLPDRLSTDPPVRQTTTDKPNGSSTPNDNSGLPTPCRISCVRAQYGEISDEAFKIISSAWRKGTERSYSSTWKKWVEWCSRSQANSLSPSLKDVVQFLTEEFMQGRQYSTINSYRSALSATLTPIDGYPVGSHPTVCKLLQGMFNQRPPAPKYKGVWSVSTVLHFVSKQLSTEGLTLKQLSKKLAVLLALTNASRSSDLHALDLDYRQFTPEGVLFRIPGLTKTRRSGPPKEAFFTSFEEDPGLCPVATLRVYEGATKKWRSPDMKPNLLFLALNKPHKPVTSASIARWIKELLTDAGVDTDKFSAHSTRAAASSSAKAAGLSTAEIMKMAGWSRQSTFEKFYHKPIMPTTNVVISSAKFNGMSSNNTMSYMQPCHDMEL